MNEFINFNNEDMKDMVEHHYVSEDKEDLNLDKQNDSKDYSYIKSEQDDSANFFAEEIEKLKNKNNKK